MDLLWRILTPRWRKLDAPPEQYHEATVADQDMVPILANTSTSGWALILLAAMLVLASACNSGKADLKDRLDAFLDAHHHHDAEAALSFLAEDYQLRFPGNFTMNKKDVENILVWDHAVNGRYYYENLEEESNTLRCLLHESNDFFQLLGLEELQAHLTYRFNDEGLLIEQIYEPVPGHSDWMEALKPAVEWARKNRADELKEIYPGDKFVHTAEMAGRWLALLRDWRAAPTGE